MQLGFNITKNDSDCRDNGSIIILPYGGMPPYSYSLDGDIIYYAGTLSTPFNGNDNWFRLTSICPGSELVFVVQINNNGEIIDKDCPA